MSNKKSPKKSLSKEIVLQAALIYADQHGIESLSMRKLADTLSVKAMSLYNHVANKDDILDGILDMVIAEIEVPDLTLEWKEAMLRRATSTRHVFLKHAWAPLPLVSRMNTGPAMLRYIDATLGCLFKAGFSTQKANYAWNAMDSYIYGFILQELNFPIEVPDFAEVAQNHLHLVPEDKFPHMAKMTHSMINGEHDGLHDFEWGFKILLHGMESCS